MQVLGRFGLRASSLMINPQLGGCGGASSSSTSSDAPQKAETKKSTAAAAKNTKPAETQEDEAKTKLKEDQAAVDSLFESCNDSVNWASFSKDKPKKNSEVVAAKKCKRGKYRKKRARGETEKDEISILASDPDLIEELKALKKMRESCKELEDLANDNDLTKQIMKFRMMSEQIEDEFWNDTCVDTNDLFADLDL